MCVCVGGWGGERPENEARSSLLLTLISLSTFMGSVTSENSSRTSERWLLSSSKTAEEKQKRAGTISQCTSQVWSVSHHLLVAPPL